MQVSFPNSLFSNKLKLKNSIKHPCSSLPLLQSSVLQSDSSSMSRKQIPYFRSISFHLMECCSLVRLSECNRNLPRWPGQKAPPALCSVRGTLLGQNQELQSHCLNPESILYRGSLFLSCSYIKCTSYACQQIAIAIKSK